MKRVTICSPIIRRLYDTSIENHLIKSGCIDPSEYNSLIQNLITFLSSIVVVLGSFSSTAIFPAT